MMFGSGLGFLVFLTFVSLGTGSTDVAVLCLSKQTNCSECITTHPECSWCTDKISTFTALQKRCKIKSENVKTCSAENIIDPKSTEDVVENEEFGKNTTGNERVPHTIIQLKPQHLNIKIRPGEIVKTNITYKKLMDYPLDLYYVLDLSLSMRDDLQNLKSFGNTLVERIKNITDNVQLGFGTFVDKVVMPYASDDEKLKTLICPSPIVCEETFGFRHQLSLTSDGSKFKDAIDKTVISFNIDKPEGSIDALMQIAVCQDIVKWRPEALHVILLTTDAEPHIAMDGKIANIHNPSEMKCQLKQVVGDEEIYEYTQSLIQDYPSLGQLRHAFRENQIQAIFAVTKEVTPLYQSFPTVFTNSYVETLSNDSSNIMTVISSAYDQIKNVFTFSEPKHPSNIQMSYRILCPNTSTWVENSLKCTNVQINSEVVIELTLNASCPANTSETNHQVTVTSAALSNIATISIEYLCECNCNSSVSQNRSFCNYRGNSKCGLCACDGGWSGPNCQCASNSSTAQLEQACTSPENGEVCSGYGSCECGTCKCSREERFGKYCQCIRSGCRKKDDDTEYCGGSSRGTCENCDNDQRCKCYNDRGWYYSNQTNLCDCSDSLCIQPTKTIICSGRGRCNCDKCLCTNSTTYYGDYCEKCGHPRCLDFDNTCAGTKHQQCALCLYKNPSNCADACGNEGLLGEVVENFPDCESCVSALDSDVCRECSKFDETIFAKVECSVKDENSCVAKYRLLWNTAYRKYYLLVKRQVVDEDCPAPIDPLHIALPVGGSVILAGVVAMIIWRLVQSRLDIQRYEEFMKELKEANWQEDNQNPVYKACIQRIENPKFVG